MRKFFLIGIVITLLIAIPLTVYILTTGRTNTQSGAAPSTVLSFTIPQQPASVGTPVTIPVTVDPTGGGGTTSNQVSFIKLVVNYDGTKLQAATSNYFTPDPKFSVLEGPSQNCDSTTNKCTISVTLTTGPDPSTAVSGLSNVGTLTFNPLVPTDPNAPTQLTFGSASQALSIASTDKPAENVIAFNRLQPGALTIVAAAATTPTPGSTGETTDSGGSSGGTSGTSSGNTSTGTTSASLTCSGLTADNTSSTTVPFTVLLTATGQDSDNITKVSFNYGDGSVQDITSGGGIGTNSISVQSSHIYKTAGTYTATAVLTDDAGNTTSPSSCSQTITIGSSSATVSSTPTTNTVTAAPTIPSTGPGQVFVGIGIAGAVITAAGLFFALGL